MGNNNSIYNGRWTDYSTNQELATYSGTASAALQAAIPIIVTFIGSQVWVVVRLILWHAYWGQRSGMWGRKKTRFKGFVEQRSTIIRNSDGGLSLTIELTKQWFHWRRPWQWKQVSTYDTWPPIFAMLVGLGHFAAWTVLGVVISFMWSSPGNSNQALVRGQCGTANDYYSDDQAQRILDRSLNSNNTISADQYVKQCYVENPGATAPCNLYASRRLNFTTSTTSCPFVASTDCVSINSSPFFMDSGYIHSSKDLGINLPEDQSILFRKMTTCSPVSSVGRAEVVSYNKTGDPLEWPGDTRLYRFYYGPVGVEDGLNDSSSSNWTYEFSSWKPEHNKYYDVSSFPWYAGGPTNIWSPNNTFWNTSRTDADVTIHFINGDAVVYQYENGDPIFVTHNTSYLEFIPEGRPSAQYTPEYYTNVLSCIDQFQICAADTKTCTQNSSSWQLKTDVNNIGLNPVQLAVAERITNLYPSLSTYNAVEGRGASGLLASLTVQDTFQAANLTVDQWRREVSHWFAITLAKLQQSVLDFASVPPLLHGNIAPPANDQLKAQCGQQRITLPSGASNFRWSAIVIFIAVGVPLWVLGFVAEDLVDLFLQYTGHEQRRLDWTCQTPLSLQRLGFQAKGVTGWRGADSEMPVWTANSSTPEVYLDISNPEEPVLNIRPNQATVINGNAASGAAPAPTQTSPPAPAPSQTSTTTPAHTSVPANGTATQPVAQTSTASVSTTSSVAAPLSIHSQSATTTSNPATNTRLPLQSSGSNNQSSSTIASSSPAAPSQAHAAQTSTPGPQVASNVSSTVGPNQSAAPSNSANTTALPAGPANSNTAASNTTPSHAQGSITPP